MRSVLCLCLPLLLCGFAAADDGSDTPGVAMATAAARLAELLPAEQRDKLHYGFADPERLNWHFIPKDRNGIVLWDLFGEPRKAAEELVKSGLSAAGYAKTLQVRSLEEVLYLFEGGEEAYRRDRRHTHKYHLTIFGTPAATGTWGWRFEGHHMSLNFVIRDGVVVSSTPEMMGANPALIDAGPGRSLRVLAAREDIARAILKACSDEQKKQMWISDKAPDDIRGAAAPQAVVDQPVGLRYADMSPDQQKMFRELLGEYLSVMPAQVVRDRMKAIEKAGMADIRMGWWGDAEVNKRHHYVIQGATFIIEYNNTQNDANHVHSIFRSLEGDFAIPTAAQNAPR
ncbi:MAG: DUF3500 domain-containing protein [Planctomyces sp.]|jgi:hypothetical protein